MSETIIGLLHRTSIYHRPSQVAWAVVWGIFCGLMPKTSLLFPACVLISLLLPIHLVAAGFVGIITGCCTPLLHPLLSNLGHWLLEGERLRQAVHRLDQLPLFPWLKLHNTVVLGSIGWSLVMAWPVSQLIQQMLAGPFANRSRQQRELPLAIQRSSSLFETEQTGPSVDSKPVLAADNFASKPHEIRCVADQVQPQPLATSLGEMEAALLSSSKSEFGAKSGVSETSSLAEVVDSIHALEGLLERVRTQAPGQTDALAVLARATKASELVDEILQSLDSSSDSPVDSTASRADANASRTDTGIADVPPQKPAVRIDAPQVFQSHDTKISIYRRARTGETLISNAEPCAPSEKDSMPHANEITNDHANLAVVEAPATGFAPIRIDSTNPVISSEGVRTSVQLPHEEALRHLLSHLRALKEKV